MSSRNSTSAYDEVALLVRTPDTTYPLDDRDDVVSPGRQGPGSGAVGGLLSPATTLGHRSPDPAGMASPAPLLGGDGKAPRRILKHSGYSYEQLEGPEFMSSSWVMPTLELVGYCLAWPEPTVGAAVPLGAPSLAT